MYCINCGEKLDDDSRFCPECGQAVISIIPDIDKKNEEITVETPSKPKSYFSVGSILNELLPVMPQFFVLFCWFSSIVYLLPKCAVSEQGYYSYLYGNDSALTHVLLLILIFIAGAIVVPFALKNNYTFLKVVMIIGLLLIIILLSFLITREPKQHNQLFSYDLIFDDSFFIYDQTYRYNQTTYLLLLIVDFFCSIVIGIRMILYTIKNKDRSIPLSISSLAILLVSPLFWLIIFAISSI